MNSRAVSSSCPLLLKPSTCLWLRLGRCTSLDGCSNLKDVVNEEAEKLGSSVRTGDTCSQRQGTVWNMNEHGLAQLALASYLS